MKRKTLVLWFCAVFVFSLYSRWRTYRSGAERCSLDGTRIVSTYRVDLMRSSKMIHSFCGIRCAREWPDVPDGGYWQVRDEMSGEVLDAARACFAESTVVTVPSRQDRTHVFKSWVDALNHIEEYGGNRIANPLALPWSSAQLNDLERNAQPNTE